MAIDSRIKKSQVQERAQQHASKALFHNGALGCYSWLHQVVRRDQVISWHRRNFINMGRNMGRVANGSCVGSLLQSFVQIIPADFRYERIESSIHWTMLDQPEVTIQLIMNWLQKD